MRAVLPARPFARRMPWAGDRLGRDIDAPPGRPGVGEALEASGLAEMSSLVEVAPGRWRALRDVFDEDPVALVGRATSRFPLLVKRIESVEPLSFQVHPDARTAAKYGEPNGKNEAWVILDAEPDAGIWLGFAEGTDQAAAKAAVRAGQPLGMVRWFEVGPGDVVPVPAGCAHAIGAGIRLFEVQEPSNVTFRLYDHGRIDEDGKARELHWDDGLAALDVDLRPEVRRSRDDAAPATETLCALPGFAIERWRLEGPRRRPSGPLAVLHVVDGEIDVTAAGESFRFGVGASAVLPAFGPDLEIWGRAAVVLFAEHR